MYAKINRLLFYLYRFLVKTDTPREGKPMCPSNMRGLNPRSSAWQADALPTKLMLHKGGRLLTTVRVHIAVEVGISTQTSLYW